MYDFTLDNNGDLDDHIGEIIKLNIETARTASSENLIFHEGPMSLVVRVVCLHYMKINDLDIRVVNTYQYARIIESEYGDIKPSDHEFLTRKIIEFITKDINTISEN
ncbi:hypothetical protein [Armatimonas sp.]|uniref:hypothetical protein n=1 Tax=Armatimonas sp. TaxID=1872638 RepID=UPI00374DEB4A